MKGIGQTQDPHGYARKLQTQSFGGLRNITELSSVWGEN